MSEYTSDLHKLQLTDIEGSVEQVLPKARGRSWVRKLPGFLTPLVVFILAAGVYSLWIPQDYTGDDLQYATTIYQAVNQVALYHPAGGRPFNPDPATGGTANLDPAVNIRYLLEWPTSIGAARLWKAVTGSDEVIGPIQALRVLAGAAALTLFFLALQTLLNNTAVAGLACAGLGLSVAFWTYSTRLDQSINMVAWLGLAFYLFARLLKAGRPVSLSRCLPLIGALALAAFYNFTAALTAVSFGLILALALPGAKWRPRLVSLVKFGAAYGLAVITVPVIILAIALSPARLVDPGYWKSASFAGHPEWQVDIIPDTFRAVLGFTKSQIAYAGAGNALQDFWDAAGTGQRIALLAFYGLILLASLVPLGVMLLKRKPDKAGLQPLFGYMVGWLGFYTLFNIWWDPGYTKYWLVPLMAWWTIAGLAILKIKERWPRWYRPAVGLGLVYVVLAFSLNLGGLFLPGSGVKAQPWQALARDLGQTYGPGALFISSGHELDFYISYFARQDILSTRLISYDLAGDTAKLQQVVRQHVADHQAAGKPVYYYSATALSADQAQQLLALVNGRQLQQTAHYEQLTLYAVVF